jgi:PAS domain S-box-containing protein
MIPRLSGSGTRNQWAAVAALVVMLAGTGLATLYIKSGVEAAARREFDFACNEIRLNIAERLAANAQILRSGAALFDATQTVTRDVWQVFSRRLQIEQQLPGIQGIGFSLLIPRDRLAAHLQEIRSQGFPDYKVRPAGERDVYSSIIYLEPFTDRNLRAFGFDMLSERVRRAAMEQARDENIPVLSGKVILVQETEKDVQAGTLMYAPVYRHGWPTDTVEQRRAAIEGWVYSPYRMTDLMRGTLRGWDVKQKDRQILLRVYDGDVVSEDTLLYDSQGGDDKALGSSAQVARTTPVAFAGHGWTLCFSQLGGLASMANYGSVWLALSGGTAISILLFVVLLSLLRTRDRAQRMAKRLSLELIDSKIRYDQLAEQSGTVTWEVDAQGIYTYVSHVSEMVWGYRPEDLVGVAYFFDLYPEPGRDASKRRTFDIFARSEEFRDLVNVLQAKDGHQVWVSTNGIPLFDDNGVLRGYRGADTDITERKRAEEELRRIWDRLSLATRVGGVGIWDYDPANNRLIWDDQMFRLYGITRDQFGGAYEAWKSGVHPEDRQRGDEDIQLALRGEKDFDCEFRVVWPDGSVHYIRAYAIVQRDASGQALNMVGTNWDITAQKQANEALQETLKENKNLLSELQHRVKNSFAMICSMISLASKAESSQETLTALEELDSRVRSVSELYSLLYSSGSFTEVQLDDYCSRVAGALAGLSANVVLNTEMESMTVPVNDAASIGLIVTELITNALKYAFPKGMQGNITISLKKTAAGADLVVRDDGIGLPVGFDISKSAGIGLRLVKAISGRLAGTIKMESDSSGTRCTVGMSWSAAGSGNRVAKVR